LATLPLELELVNNYQYYSIGYKLNIQVLLACSKSVTKLCDTLFASEHLPFWNGEKFFNATKYSLLQYCHVIVGMVESEKKPLLGATKV